MSNARKFGLDISAFVAKAKANMNAVTRKVVLDVGTSLVEKTPVGDGALWKHPPPKGYVGGRARANWSYQENTLAEVLDAAYLAADPSGRETIARIASSIPNIAAGKIHFLVNRLPYIQRLEGGWSTQAPNGMVALTVIEFRNIVAAAVAEVKK